MSRFLTIFKDFVFYYKVTTFKDKNIRISKDSTFHPSGVFILIEFYLHSRHRRLISSFLLPYKKY